MYISDKMTEETITFEFIRKIHLSEKNSTTLTKLPENFFLSSINYLNKKKKTISNDDRKSTLELRTIERLIEDIFNRRERKILNLAIISARTGLPPENLTEEEKTFYNSLLDLIKSRRETSLKIFSSTDIPKNKNKVTFKENVPAFVGSDMVTYGPFKKGDIAVIPEDNMKILLEKGIVEK